MSSHDVQEALGASAKCVGCRVQQGSGSVFVIFRREDISMRLPCLSAETAPEFLDR